MDLETRYRAYLAVLNSRRFDDLVDFVEDTLTYNDEPMTRRQYADLIAADVKAIPDLVYHPKIIVSGADQVACRLLFVCTPKAPFLGFAPNGTQLTFAEHVFYTFTNDRIAAVTSMIDRAAIATQLSRT